MKREGYLDKLKNFGVKIVDPLSTFIDESCFIGKNTIIFPNNYIQKGTIIGENCVIEEGNHFENTKIGNDNKIVRSFFVDSEIFDHNKIGPFSLVLKSKIFSFTKIGNFVEVNNSQIFCGAKIDSHSRISGAEIGKKTHIGCGVIFCDHSGEKEFSTIIGDNCFIGSNCNIISPLIIGENTFVSCGCTVYKNIESNQFVISKPELKIEEDYKKNYLKSLKKNN